MSSKKKRLVRGAAASAVILSTLALGNPVSAGPICIGVGGLCVYDGETSASRIFAGDTPDWGVYGWDDRADWFSNRSTSKNVCVFQLHYYRGSGITILRGKQWAYPNFGRSNLWTSKTHC